MFDYTLPASAGVLPVENLHISAPLDGMPSIGQDPGSNTPPPGSKFQVELGQTGAGGTRPPKLTVDDPVNLGQDTSSNAPPPQPKLANLGQTTEVGAPPPQPK